MSQNFDIPKQMFAIVTTGNGSFDKLSHKIVDTPEINKNDIDKIVSILRQGIIQSMEELKSKDLWHN